MNSVLFEYSIFSETSPAQFLPNSNWRAPLIGQDIYYPLGNVHLNLRIRPPLTATWKHIDFKSQTAPTLLLQISIIVSESVVSVYSSGNDCPRHSNITMVCAFKPASQWIDLTLVQDDNSFNVSCGDGEITISKRENECRAVHGTFDIFRIPELFGANSVIYKNAPPYWEMPVENTHIRHPLKEFPLNMKMATSPEGVWRRLTFYSTDKAIKMEIFFYVTQTGISHVNMATCGTEQRALESCQVEDGRWVYLVLEKFGDLSLHISCNSGRPVVFGKDCVTKIGNDLVYFYPTFTVYGSFMYQVGNLAGMMTQMGWALGMLQFSTCYFCLVIKKISLNISTGRFTIHDPIS